MIPKKPGVVYCSPQARALADRDRKNTTEAPEAASKKGGLLVRKVLGLRGFRCRGLGV